MFRNISITQVRILLPTTTTTQLVVVAWVVMAAVVVVMVVDRGQTPTRMNCIEKEGGKEWVIMTPPMAEGRVINSIVIPITLVSPGPPA